MALSRADAAGANAVLTMARQWPQVVVNIGIRPGSAPAPLRGPRRPNVADAT